jgi:DNA-directed RNA polymerase subunit M/transcription elongation factor TFIIS
LSAVRNLHAGILLLFKEKLRRLSSPESKDILLMAKSEFTKNADGKVISIGAGQKTVDVRQIQERFENLGVITDWKRFEKISKLRNDIEHYFTTVSQDAMRTMISNSFLIIRNFITEELDDDPQDLLGEESWKKMLSVSEVLEKERSVCQQAIAAINWESDSLAEAISDLTCPECGSPLLLPVEKARGANLRCRSCGEETRFDNYAPRALTDHFAADNHYSYKDGGDPATIICPFCFEETYIVAENKCVLCRESCQTTCSRCDNEIPVCELSDGRLCSYCEHMISKDD